MNKKNLWFDFKGRVLVAFCVFFLGWLALINMVYAQEPEYSGLIAVKNGVPLTPDPLPPNLPTNNLRFFLDNSKPSPKDTGLTSAQIVPQGDANDAVYNIIPFGTITVLADNGTNYGKTYTGKNITSGLSDTLTFVSGAYKTYELLSMDLPYKKEPPIAPPSDSITATLEGYRKGDFKPLITVSIASYADPDHEKSDKYYKYEIYEGTDPKAKDSLETNNSSWQPDPGKLSNTDVLKTYTVKIYAHNWFGHSASPTEKPVDVPPISVPPAPTTVTETWTLYAPSGKTSINTLAIPFIDPDTKEKIPKKTTKVDGTPVDISTVENLIKAVNEQIAPAKVSTFGWYKETTQIHTGLTSIGYQDGNLSKANSSPIDNSYEDIVGSLVITNRAYQVSINGASDVQAANGMEFKLTGYKQ